MTFEKNLQAKKEEALQAYKLAKAEFMATVTKENIKGDLKKWVAFCDCKKICMKLGCRI